MGPKGFWAAEIIQLSDYSSPVEREQWEEEATARLFVLRTGIEDLDRSTGRTANGT